MKFIFVCLIFFFNLISFASEKSHSSEVTVVVKKSGNVFEILASYVTSMDICNAFNFITDYEDAKNIPGVIESRVLSRTDNKVLVERKARETILMFPLEISSIIEYIETPNQGLKFEQIRGDNKMYKGTWRLDEREGFTKLIYQSVVEPNSSAPDMVLEYFMRNIIRKRFEAMADRAILRSQTNSQYCPKINANK
jgi:hypothetical protein